MRNAKSIALKKLPRKCSRAGCALGDAVSASSDGNADDSGGGQLAAKALLSRYDRKQFNVIRGYFDCDRLADHFN